MFIIPILIIPIAIIIGLFLLVNNETKNMETLNNAGAGNTGTLEEKKSPAFHLFLYLLTFLSLGFVISGIMVIYFQLINKLIKDPEEGMGYSGIFDSAALKFAISSLIVAAVIYFVSLYFINRKLVKGEISETSVVRKFITYLALFVLSVMSIGSLVSLIYNYLDGELTGKVFLKILVFFVVSAFFFSFYFWEIRRKEFPGKIFSKLYALSIVLALSALVVGFVIVDSPKVTREKRMDKDLVNNMSSLTYNIQSFYAANTRLPKVENKEIKPEEGIEYKIINDTDYQLCANFKHAAEKEYPEDKWAHRAGYSCFNLNGLNEGIGDLPMTTPMIPTSE